MARLRLLLLKLGGLLALLGLALCLDRAATLWLSPYAVGILTLVGINVTLAVSLNLINGYTGQFSIGHGGFMAVGAYVAASVTVYGGRALLDHYPHILEPQQAEATTRLVGYLLFVGALALGGLVAAGVGILVGLPTLRLRGDYLAIATLGFGEIVKVILLNVPAVGGARGFTGIPRYTSIFAVYFVALLTIVMVRNLMQSAHGRAFLAVREDEVAAEAVGINTTAYKVSAFCLGAFFAGVAGGLFGHYLMMLHPRTFDFFKSIEIIVMVVLGGSGSTTGVVLAATILTVLPERLRQFKEWRMVVYSVLLVLMMLVRREGLMGYRELGWGSLAGAGRWLGRVVGKGREELKGTKGD